MPEKSKELANLARVGKLAIESGTHGEIKGLLTSGSERLADARNEVRNVAEYEGHFDADATMLRNLIEAATAVRAAVMVLPALPET